MNAPVDLEAFEAGGLDPSSFSHRAHIEMAVAMLARTDFLDAARRYQKGVESLALKAGAQEKANLTVTLAFLSIIAERIENTERSGDFLLANPDLLDSRLLLRLYDSKRLASPLARRVFLLPGRL
jgi:hypothetical protein